jgi:hypothetical protein
MLFLKLTMVSSYIIKIQHFDGVKVDICAHLHYSNPKISTLDNSSKFQFFFIMII